MKLGNLPSLTLLALGMMASMPAKSLTMDLVGRYQTGIYGEAGAEIVDYHKNTQSAYVVDGAKNRIDIISLSKLPTTAINNPLTANTLTAMHLNLPEKVTTSDNQVLSLGTANSLSIYGDWLAVAVANVNKKDDGVVLFYKIEKDKPELFKAVQVGALPDMVTFTPDGQKVLVANEGEPTADYQFDPVGSIGVINMENSMPANTAVLMMFDKFESQKAELQAKGFKFASPKGHSLAQDIEPEYITVSDDSKTAWVSLQENNALAKIDLVNNDIVAIHPLGLKDFGDKNNGIDASDKDKEINIRSWEGVYGLYQPDTIYGYSVNGQHFTVTANEGDSRDWWFGAADEKSCLDAGGSKFDEEDGCLAYSEETRAGKLTLADTHPQLSHLDNKELGRLKVTKAMGDEDGDGKYEKIVTFGARSFSIWNDNGELVFDSGNQFAKTIAERYPEGFNTNESENKKDNRSDDKGSEPEALAIGQVDGKTYAFIGLERMGGIMIYDVSNPKAPNFVDYILNRDLTVDYEIDDSTNPVTLKGDYAKAGDLAPEGMRFIKAENSPTKNALLLVANEVSGTVSVYQIK
ncbi:choice-of-anchor I family protein [Vibrio rumoiensis]|uniref:Alkaline phosphatase n=1 Tax=Vibrio rumoiensis 1S-45 TaxID=1188252 RepID=A0A1E5E4B4_9VIBR|nr:choice-of-anchor I family protein [Vibrio rumoiensis]OEF27592.1 alkaline phosphatase [Vibrio rumoiensis 1S-45]